MALYTHCNSHVLNLSVTVACRLTSVGNKIGTLNETFLFFYFSPKDSDFQNKFQRSGVLLPERRSLKACAKPNGWKGMNVTRLSTNFMSTFAKAWKRWLIMSCILMSIPRYRSHGTGTLKPRHKVFWQIGRHSDSFSPFDHKEQPWNTQTYCS